MSAYTQIDIFLKYLFLQNQAKPAVDPNKSAAKILKPGSQKKTSLYQFMFAPALPNIDPPIIPMGIII